MSKVNWVNNERICVKMFQDWGIPVQWIAKEERKDANKSCHDVEILLPSELKFKIDAKFTKGGLAHHKKLSIIEQKYCKEKNDAPLLFSRTIGARYGTFTIKNHIFLGLLAYWLGAKTREEVLNQWGIQ